MDVRTKTDSCAKIPVIVIFAPTASGKTALAGALFSDTAATALAGRVEIVSADSMQVYTGMDIGTAKPDADFLVHLPHHLINICSVRDQFSVSQFVRQADTACRDIRERGKIPVVLGGTAFYIRNFITGLPVTPAADESVRKRLQERMRREGAAALYEELRQKDPCSAERIHLHDEYRICRALEVWYACGKPLSSFALPENPRSEYDFCVIELVRPREELYRRIDMRVDSMFGQGLVQEVRNLISAGYTQDDPGMQAIGYREFFLPGISCPPDSGVPLWSDEALADIRERIKLDSRHYAKRQITFFKPMRQVHRISAGADDEIYRKITDFLSHYLT